MKADKSRFWLPVIGVLLFWSLVGNGFQLYSYFSKPDSVEAAAQGLEQQSFIRPSPEYILNMAKRIEQNNAILQANGYSADEHTIYFLASPELNEDVAFYALNELRKENNKTEPMIYESPTDPFVYFAAFQDRDEQYVLIQLELGKDGSVVEKGRNTISDIVL